MNITLTTEDLATLERALDDAVGYRDDVGACGDCGDVELCEDHTSDRKLADEYAALAEKIKEQTA